MGQLREKLLILSRGETEMKRIVTAVALAVSSCATAPATASSDCKGYDEMADFLIREIGEQTIIAAASHSGTAIIFWLNPKTDTWTITETIGDCTYIREYGHGVVIMPLGEPA